MCVSIAVRNCCCCMIAYFLLFAELRLVVTIRQEAHNMTGANADLHHCHDVRDAHNLLVLPELPPAKSIYMTPWETTDDIHPRIDTPLRFGFELPYLAFDCRYRIRFAKDNTNNREPNQCSTEAARPRLESVEADLQSEWSDDVDQLFPDLAVPPANRTEQRTWAHAPNAAYPGALRVPRYGAYYVSPQSVWQVQESERYRCSEVMYVTSATLDNLRACGALAITSLANDTVRVASYAVELELATPANARYGANRIETHLYVDKYDNTVHLTLVNGISFDSRVTLLSATLGQLGILEEQDDRLEFVIVARASQPLHSDMLWLHKPKHVDIEFLHSSEKPRKDADGAFVHRWTFATNSSVSVLDERLTIDVRTHKHMHHSDVCSIHLDFLIANPRALQLASSRGGGGTGLLTNHVVLYNGKGLVESDVQVDDGSRVCMINNVFMPTDMALIVAVRLVEAWLCVVSAENKASGSEKNMQCEDQRHTIALFKDGKPNRDLNVSVAYPGRLGANSVELCFNTTLRITDSEDLTLNAPQQRYESRVELVPRTQLAHGPSLFESLAEERELVGVNGALRADSNQTEAFAAFHVQRALKKIGRDNADFHVRALALNIASEIGTTHNMSAFSANAILILVFLMIVCVFVAYFVISSVNLSALLRRQRRTFLNDAT